MRARWGAPSLRKSQGDSFRPIRLRGSCKHDSGGMQADVQTVRVTEPMVVLLPTNQNLAGPQCPAQRPWTGFCFIDCVSEFLNECVREFA
jgi:hypothetical protein